MTKRLLITSASLCLLLSGCATQDPKPPTPLLIAPPPPVCASLVPCRLPGRPPLKLNEDPYHAIDETEDALTSCASQVIDCINLQNAAKGMQGRGPLSVESKVAK
ncbi:Rz1-like lysis system protein LysC [Pseudomonas sp. MPR-ANC1]|uniref:Rz1-like lysis system protein LysC n=1 Tax=Pseudomonas sp. MPR-ANC1 TaxID=2075548 RepID=UPI001C467313